MTVKYSHIFIFVILLHLCLMMVPVMKKMVVELNVQDPVKISITLLLQDNDVSTEDVTFVETDTQGVKEEVDTKYISDSTQMVEDQTVSHQNKGGGNAGKKGEEKKEIELTDLKPNLSGEIIPKAQTKEGDNKDNSQSGKTTMDGTGETYPLFDEDIAEGDKTSLNTIEFKYASFYKRMKEQVGNTWIPLVTNLSTSAVGPGNHVTRIILKINKDGEITGLKMDAASGISVLDEIAYKTFTKVRIFPNPPTALFNGKEYLYIPWTLELRN